MNKRWPIYLTLLAALVLEVIPLPVGVNIYRPDWLLMALIFWNVAQPTVINIGIAFVCGILLDVLLGYNLGLHSLACSLVMFVSSVNYQRMKNYSIWQQIGVVALLSAFFNITVFWLQHWLTDIFFHFNYFWPIITTALLWPWVFWFLYRIKQRYML
ncbi:MAG: rod shape-determining protein MreD [Glaciecola sp.]|jgi:rod shape-determining protein MreD